MKAGMVATAVVIVMEGYITFIRFGLIQNFPPSNTTVEASI